MSSGQSSCKGFSSEHPVPCKCVGAAQVCPYTTAEEDIGLAEPSLEKAWLLMGLPMACSHLKEHMELENQPPFL